MTTPLVSDSILYAVYMHAKSQVVLNGFVSELVMATRTADGRIDLITESVFLRETAWVMLSSGMAERVVRQRFTGVTAAFYGWHSADEILMNRESCRRGALEFFNNPRKIDAIFAAVQLVWSTGIEELRTRLCTEPLNVLQQLPFIGPVTVFHLMKNLGANTSKPDRHLSRFATLLGFETPHGLCDRLSKLSGDCTCVVDSALWRFATLNLNYLDEVANLAGVESHVNCEPPILTD